MPYSDSSSAIGRKGSGDGHALAYVALRVRHLVRRHGIAGSVRLISSRSGSSIEVLRLVARGRTNAEIGRELLISEATVKTHLLRAFGKLGVSDRTAAVTAALERGILPAPGR